MKGNFEIAKRFWQSRKEYPNYPYTQQRRLIDANYIIPKVVNAQTLVDLGCGDGSMILALKKCTKINTFYAFDISQKFIDDLVDNYGSSNDEAFLVTKVVDFTKIKLPKADVTISLGSFMYIFEEDDLYSTLANIRSNILIVRVPCSINGQDEHVNTYSEDLGDNYSAVYRTALNYNTLFNKFYPDVRMERAYPDVIESKYGTKHFFFTCERQ